VAPPDRWPIAQLLAGSQAPDHRFPRNALSLNRRPAVRLPARAGAATMGDSAVMISMTTSTALRWAH